MKKIVFSLLFSFISHIIHAQSNETYVEVIVTDTVQAEPDEIYYTIYCYDQYQGTDMPLKQNNKPQLSPKMTSPFQIRSVIRKMNLDTMPFTQYTLNKQEYNPSFNAVFTVRFSSLEKLKLFVTELEPIKSISGFISSSKTSKENEFKEKLIKRVLDKAEQDATLIAAQSKKTLGRLLQVKEQAIEDPGIGWTMYPPLSALAQSNYTTTSSSDKIIFSKRLIVRYAW